MARREVSKNLGAAGLASLRNLVFDSQARLVQTQESREIDRGGHQGEIAGSAAGCFLKFPPLRRAGTRRHQEAVRTGEAFGCGAENDQFFLTLCRKCVVRRFIELFYPNGTARHSQRPNPCPSLAYAI